MFIPNIVLVRHGQTTWSLSGKHTGRTDVELDSFGIDQAKKVGKVLQGISFQRVLSSPLSRALDTCFLAGFEPSSVEINNDLVEWDYGDYEGKTTLEIQQERPSWNVWEQGVINGETLDQIAQRVDRVISSLKSDKGPHIIFAHGHLLRILAARWMSLEPSVGGKLQLSPASISVLSSEHGIAGISKWNQQSHLEDNIFG